MLMDNGTPWGDSGGAGFTTVSVWLLPRNDRPREIAGQKADAIRHGTHEQPVLAPSAISARRQRPPQQLYSDSASRAITQGLPQWRNALAIARPDQSCHVKRAHPPPCLVTEMLQERLEPALKLFFPM